MPDSCAQRGNFIASDDVSRSGRYLKDIAFVDGKSSFSRPNGECLHKQPFPLSIALFAQHACVSLAAESC